MVKQKLLIIGGGGFLGYHLINLLKNNYEIYNYDLCVEGFSVENLHKDIKRNYLPINNYEQIDYKIRSVYQNLFKSIFNNVDTSLGITLEKIIRTVQPDLIINLASLSHVDTSISSPTSFVKYNVEKFIELLETVKSYNFTIPILHMSTDEVFGSVELRDSVDSIDEAPYKPSSIYSQTKTSQEQIIDIYRKAYNMNISIVRSTNLIGTHQDSKKLIPTIFRNIIEGNPIPLYGDGRQSRMWLSTTDASKMIQEIVVNMLHFPEISYCNNWHISNPDNYISNKDLVELISERLKMKGFTKPVIVEYVKDRLNHDVSYALDNDFERTQLRDLNNIIDELIEYYIPDVNLD